MVIKGSPREKSNSNLMLDKVLEGIEDDVKEDLKVKVLYAAQEDISPCRGCFHCDEKGECIIKDEMQQIYKEIDKADIILISTPIFFNGVSAQLKKIIDRCQAIWGSKYVAKDPIIDRDKKRLGFLLASGGAEVYEDQFVGVYKVMEMFFKVTNTNWKGKIVISNSDEVHVSKRENILREAYQAGEDLAVTMSC
nr:flavodoxin family protein [Sporohalobacter salinus]